MSKITRNISDEELLACYLENGKPEQLALLYEPYMPLVYGVALKYLKNNADAQDTVMQIFEELLEKVKRYEIRIFRAWLYTYVRNYCLMELRRRSATLSVSLDENFMEFCDDFNLDDIQMKEATEKILRKCIEALPEKQRISIYRFFVEERSYKEIEEATGFSLKSVKSLIQNGKRNLKLCLEKKKVL